MTTGARADHDGEKLGGSRRRDGRLVRAPGGVRDHKRQEGNLVPRNPEIAPGINGKKRGKHQGTIRAARSAFAAKGRTMVVARVGLGIRRGAARNGAGIV